MSDVIIVEKIQKTDGKVQALKKISYRVKTAEIFGLLGPNGAGKTTTIRCLTTLGKPDAGEILIGGVSAISQPKQVRELIGYVAQEVAIDKMLTGRELLSLQASLYHYPHLLAKTELIS